MEQNNDFTVLDRCPFLTLIEYSGERYMGVVQNSDAMITSMYVYERVPPEAKRTYLRLAETWWWQSNRTIPINIFLSEWEQFRPTLRSFSTKDMVVIKGPCVSLAELVSKKPRRRNITLISR